jgi:hypothetical protein
VICYSPMQSGLLTNSFTADRVASLAADDWRRQAPEFQEPSLRQNLLLRDARSDRGTARHVGVLDRHRMDAGVAGRERAIVGARSPQQVDGWIGRGVDCADPERPRRNRNGHSADGGWCWVGAAGEGTLEQASGRVVDGVTEAQRWTRIRRLNFVGVVPLASFDCRAGDVPRRSVWTALRPPAGI